MATDDKQEEIAGLRALINDDAIRDERGVQLIKDANAKLKAKVDELEAGGFIQSGEFDDVKNMYEEATSFLSPIAASVRPAELNGDVQKRVDAVQYGADPDRPPQTGVITDKNVIEAGGADGMNIDTVR